ncbi:MAG TPA: universal stress protein [Terriglobales bacterium]|nr:universal stress protein [Terriglobales bacterium]
MKILLAIDSSADSEVVVREAASRPWPSGAVFCVMTVVDMRSLEGMPVLIEDAKREAEKLMLSAAKTLVTRADGTLRQPGNEVFSEIQLGEPNTAIQDFATKWGANLILIGARGLSSLERFLLGSVAQAVLRTAPCSVEVVRRPPLAAPHPAEGLKILLGTDGSEFSSKAAYSVANRPWPPGSQVRIISVQELLVPEAVAASSLQYSVYSERSMEEVSEVTRKRAEDAVAQARSILGSAHLAISDAPQDAPVGDPRTILLDEAKSWEADLIVVGSHGKRGFDRLLLGSVSESVAMHAHCSVEVIRG